VSADRPPATGAPAPFVLFTDLDGTLLDASYRAGPAAPALARLLRAGVPVVFCSSKTCAEQVPLKRRLGVDGPFVVENGSAVLFPPPCQDLPRGTGWCRDVLGVDVARLRTLLATRRSALGIEARGFADMTVQEVARAAGLSVADARRARRREYSETLVGLRPAEVARLGEALHVDGLQLVQGGRFHTVIGAGADKGQALVRVMERWRSARGTDDVPSIAVGDSTNDVAMLRAADRAFLVSRRDGHSPEVQGVERLDGIGPSGFAELVERLLGDLEAGRAPALRR